MRNSSQAGGGAGKLGKSGESRQQQKRRTWQYKWAGRSPLDPWSHLWIEAGQDLVRLCDGQPWTGPPINIGLGFCLPCHSCIDTSIVDSILGRGIFRSGDGFPRPYPKRSYQVPAATGCRVCGAYNKQDGCAPFHSADVCPSRETDMLKAPRLTMRAFAQYYRARPDTRANIVLEKRKTLENPEQPVYGDARYARLRRAIIESHIKHADITRFQRGLPDILRNIMPHHRARCAVVAHEYAAFWHASDATPFEGRRVNLDMAGLTTFIDPELRIQYANGRQQLLKLWFGSKPPPKTWVPVVAGLMNMAGQQQGWPQSWTKGYLDIERKKVLALGMDDATAEPLLLDAASDFMYRWRS